MESTNDGAKKIGYARVSTDEQNLDLQVRALKAAGCDVIYTDSGISGAARSRPGLGKALKALRQGYKLVVWRLDRLGRSLLHLVQLLETLGERGISFRSLCEYIDTSSSGGRLVFHMMAALAEFERSLISERTRAGMAAARARGQHIGRLPSMSPAQCGEARRLLAGGLTADAVALQFDVSPRTLNRLLSRHEPDQAGRLKASTETQQVQSAATVPTDRPAKVAEQLGRRGKVKPHRSKAPTAPLSQATASLPSHLERHTDVALVSNPEEAGSTVPATAGPCHEATALALAPATLRIQWIEPAAGVNTSPMVEACPSTRRREGELLQMSIARAWSTRLVSVGFHAPLGRLALPSLQHGDMPVRDEWPRLSSAISHRPAGADTSKSAYSAAAALAAGASSPVPASSD